MTPTTLNPPFVHANLRIPAAGVILTGDLTIPVNARGLVIFAHGSGSSRLSPRNTYVASVLQQAGIATLLFDLLTRAEDVDYATRFDIELLTRRLLAATSWVKQQPQTRNFKIGYFGASTGAAAALQAAAELQNGVDAVVSRGGRPDLAGGAALRKVSAPTLLIVGGYDDEVIELNEQAYALLACKKELAIVPGATHLFEEPGTLEQAARKAANWFSLHLEK
jgi:dienelactone hydrolase